MRAEHCVKCMQTSPLGRTTGSGLVIWWKKTFPVCSVKEPRTGHPIGIALLGKWAAIQISNSIHHGFLWCLFHLLGFLVEAVNLRSGLLSKCPKGQGGVLQTHSENVRMTLAPGPWFPWPPTWSYIRSFTEAAWAQHQAAVAAAVAHQIPRSLSLQALQNAAAGKPAEVHDLAVPFETGLLTWYAVCVTKTGFRSVLLVLLLQTPKFAHQGTLWRCICLAFAKDSSSWRSSAHSESWGETTLCAHKNMAWEEVFRFGMLPDLVHATGCRLFCKGFLWKTIHRIRGSFWLNLTDFPLWRRIRH